MQTTNVYACTYIPGDMTRNGSERQGNCTFAYACMYVQMYMHAWTNVYACMS